MIPRAACKDRTEQRGPQASPGVTACEVDRPDSVSPAAVAERFHTAQAVRRTRAVIGCFMQAANIENPPWCALQRLAGGCIGTARQLKAVCWALSYFCVSRASQVGAPCCSCQFRTRTCPPNPGPNNETRRQLAPALGFFSACHHLQHARHAQHGCCTPAPRRRLTTLDVIAVPAYRPLSRARGQQIRHCLMLTACRMPARVSPP